MTRALAPTPLNQPPTEPHAAPADSRSAQPSGTEPIKQVPQSRHSREQIRRRALEMAAGLDKSQPLDEQTLQAHARAILEDLNEPEAYLGWTMVALASGFWHDQVAATPFHRRLLLLPHCLRNADRCPGTYNEWGLLCRACGACSLAELRLEAEQLGYNVLIAEGSPTVMQIIVGGHADALVGVSCLDVLEKSLEKILLAGIPCMAVPLLAGTCRDTSTDEDWVREMIQTPHCPAAVHTRTYVHLLRCAKGMFQLDQLDWLAPRSRGGHRLAETNGQGLSALDPLASTEAIAYDFLLRGGKRARPFVTLAAYDAMTGALGTEAAGAEHVARIPEAVKRVALAIEIFHKASLVHDDIEDDDAYRYGHPTLHRKYGVATAINVGDYLIGLGYRLVAEQRTRLGAEMVADILAQLADTHTRLSEGQGAELAWRSDGRRPLAPAEALRIYALKTAPAFEAAIYTGLRLAGPAQSYRRAVARYARHLGVAFQILNDLDDWQPNPSTKRTNGSRLVGARPTVLWALALENLGREEADQLELLVRGSGSEDDCLERLAQLYQRADVYQQAETLIGKHRERAHEIAQQLDPDPLCHLLHYLADSILKR